MRVLRSSLLDRHGFRHAFATRAGGVSAPPFDTLNLGFHLGDGEANVTENRNRFAATLGVSQERLYEQRQMHGNFVREIREADEVTAVADAEGDALLARDVGLAVAARTADCVPILLAHPPTGHVAAVHAGWRGAVAEIVPRAVLALALDPSRVIAAIGPHIRVDAFEIGEDVADEMERAAKGRPVVEHNRSRPHGDLAKLVSLQLLDSGVPELAIDDVGGCTYAEAAYFFSHRRERGKTGRHLSAIVAKSPA